MIRLKFYAHNMYNSLLSGDSGLSLFDIIFILLFVITMHDGTKELVHMLFLYI